MRDRFQGTGKPEPLKYVLAWAWSRRITEEPAGPGGRARRRPRRDCCAPAWRYDEAGELQQCGHENGGQVDAHQSVEAHKNIVELPEASANTPA